MNCKTLNKSKAVGHLVNSSGRLEGVQSQQSGCPVAGVPVAGVPVAGVPDAGKLQTRTNKGQPNVRPNPLWLDHTARDIANPIPA